MQKTAFILRPMELSDIGSAMKLSNAESWNQTEKDWKLLVENPDNVCLVAECGNKVIGTTTAINYSNQIAWIGMVLVDKEYRGQGVSKSLLTKIFKKLEFCKSVKLDATLQGQQVYKKFDFQEEYFIARMASSLMKDLPSGDGNEIIPEPIQLKHIPETEFLPQAENYKAQLIQVADSNVLKDHPQAKWLQQQLNISTAQTKLEKAKLSPDLTLSYSNQSFVGFQNINGTDKYFNGGHRFSSVQAGIGIPIFKSAQKAKVNASKINQLLAEK